MLFRSRYFLDRVCTHTVAFEGEGRVAVVVGNPSYHLEKRRRAEAAQPRKTDATTRSIAAVAPALVEADSSARKRKLSYKEQRELEGMEAVILAAEAKVAEMDAALASPDFHKSVGARAPQFLADLESARAEVARLYSRWEELSARA